LHVLIKVYPGIHGCHDVTSIDDVYVFPTSSPNQDFFTYIFMRDSLKFNFVLRRRMPCTMYTLL